MLKLRPHQEGKRAFLSEGPWGGEGVDRGFPELPKETRGKGSRLA